MKPAARLGACTVLLLTACAAPDPTPPLPPEPYLLYSISPRRAFATESRSHVADRTAEVIDAALSELGEPSAAAVRRGEDQLAVVLPETGASEVDLVAALLGSRVELSLALLVADDAEPGAAEALGKLQAALAEGGDPASLALPALDTGDGLALFRFVRVPAGLAGEPLQAGLGVPAGLAFVRLDSAVARRFGELEVSHVEPQRGGGLLLHLVPERAGAFAEFTGSHAGQRLAVVVDGALAAPPLLLAGPLESPLRLDAPVDDEVAASHARLALLGTPGRLHAPRPLPSWVD